MIMDEKKRFPLFALSPLETVCIVRRPSLTPGTVVVILMLLSCCKLRRLDLHFSMFTERDCRGKNWFILDFFPQHSIYVVVQESL